MEFLLYPTALLLDFTIKSLCLYAGTLFSFVKIRYKHLLPIALIAWLTSWIPWVGLIAGTIAFIWLLIRVTNCRLVDALWVIAFSTLFMGATSSLLL